MPKYIIERDIAGVGNLTADALHAVSQTSCSGLNEIGPSIKCVHALSQGTRSTAYTSLRTRKWSVNMQCAGAFLRM